MYEVVIPKSVTKQIRRLPVEVQERVLAKLATLGENPRPHTCRKLVAGKELYRLRVGSYRVIYSVDDDEQVVVIYRVAHRREVYR